MRTLVCRLILGSLALADGVALAQSPQVTSYQGQPLAYALQDLQRRGVNVIYSSDLVTDAMIVHSEPLGASLDQMIDRLLGPYGLEAEIGPRGSVLVVRRGAEPIMVWITSPSPEQAVFGKVLMAADVVTKEELDRVEFFVNDRVVATLREPPFEAHVELGDQNLDREFKVVAYGAWGGLGAAIVSIDRLEIDERVEIALKQLYVTVERSGSRLLDLGRESFTVFDKGDRRELVTFERGDVPISAVLLLDASESMKGEPLQAVLDGSRSFLSRMNSLDQSMVILFSDRTLVASRFTNRQDELLAGLQGVEASGGTALNDYLYAGLRLLDHVYGRRVVILLSDGSDVLSTLRMQDILWKVRRSDALIYWLRHDEGRSGQFSSSWRDYEANKKESLGLERAIKESGGRILTLAGLDQIEPAFEEIMSELREQYVLGYYPGQRVRDGSWRPVEVSVNVPSARARFRAGYVDY